MAVNFLLFSYFHTQSKFSRKHSHFSAKVCNTIFTSLHTTQQTTIYQTIILATIKTVILALSYQCRCLFVILIILIYISWSNFIVRTYKLHFYWLNPLQTSNNGRKRKKMCGYMQKYRLTTMVVHFRPKVEVMVFLAAHIDYRMSM